MEKFKVIALNVTAANGKVHYAGEELNENQLGGLEIAKTKVKQGFLVALKTKLAKVGDLIELIEKAETVEAVNEIVGEDSRAKVLEAAEGRKSDLEVEAELAKEELAKTDK